MIEVAAFDERAQILPRLGDRLFPRIEPQRRRYRWRRDRQGAGRLA